MYVNQFTGMCFESEQAERDFFAQTPYGNEPLYMWEREIVVDASGVERERIVRVGCAEIERETMELAEWEPVVVDFVPNLPRRVVHREPQVEPLNLSRFELVAEREPLSIMGALEKHRDWVIEREPMILRFAVIALLVESIVCLLSKGA